MYRVPLTSRMMLAIAARVVPRRDRERWRERWDRRLEAWWYYNSAVPGARFDLLREGMAAVHDALAIRYGWEDHSETWRHAFGHPLAVVLVLSAAWLALALFSGGFRETKAWLHTGGERLVLATDRGYFGSHATGVPSSRFLVWPKYQTSLEEYSAFVWKQTDDGKLAGAVQPSFFDLTGARAVAGSLFTSDVCPDCAIARTPAAIGRSFSVLGRRYRVTGALSQQFRFASVQPDYWIPLDLGHLPAKVGVIGRLRRGVSLEHAQRDLGAGVSALSYLRQETILFLTLPLLLSIALALFRTTHDRAFWAFMTGPLRKSWLFWTFYIGKTSAALLFVAFTAVEIRYGVTLTSTAARDPFLLLVATWPILIAFSIAAWWAWADQRLRCRTCLRRLDLPVHMGVLGEALAGPTGIESVCPAGHGALYMPDTPLSDAAWITLDEFFSAPAK